MEIRNRRLSIDGEPTVLMAGEVHYFRVAKDEWADRLEKLADIGCRCVASYIPWLWHELPDGTVDLTGDTRPERDLGSFIDLCADHGLAFLARPGPFVMAELKNEGIPYRVYRDHPEIRPEGWNGAPSQTASVDYLAPAFLAEAKRWYAAVIPLLAARQSARGGNVVALQLDNEIGMLSWVSNTPLLTAQAVTDFGEWVCTHHPDYPDRYPIDWSDPAEWARTVRSPAENVAAYHRVDLGNFHRDRIALYVEALAASARHHGMDATPFLINIHGTEGGNGVPFGIGVSQLFRSYSGQPGLAAGSDHYLGDMSLSVTCDIHFINAAMACVNGPDQALTSLEFEAGTGDYGGGLDQLYDASTNELKTRLCLAQGNRLINYYLLAGGVNPPLDEPVGDGNDRISFTGELHGRAAPIGPHGERGLTYAGTRATVRGVAANAAWLADMDEEFDPIGVGLWPDAFMTEHHYPDSAIITDLVDDLSRHRGPGPRKALWRSLLFAGYRFSAVNLQDAEQDLPRVVALSCGRVLDRDVQARLAHHVLDGGGLLLMGRLPEVDQLLQPCTQLAEAVMLRGEKTIRSAPDYYPSVSGRGLLSSLPETRVDRLTPLDGPSARPILVDTAGRMCGALVTPGRGRAAVVAAELPSDPRVFTALATWLGAPNGLALRTDVPGVVATTTVGPGGQRLVHLINPTGYPATVQVDVPDSTGVLDGPLHLPARTGAMLPLGVEVRHAGVTILAANAEITDIDDDAVVFGPALGEKTVVWLGEGASRRCVTAAGGAPCRVALQTAGSTHTG